MARVQSSTLPPVLKEYLPEYEPKSPVLRRANEEAVPPGAEKSQDQHAQKKSPRSHSSKSGQGTSSKGQGSEKVGGGGAQKRHSLATTQGSRPVVRRERTKDILRRQEEERFQRNYKNWQQIKEDQKDEQTEKLRSKIEIQQELIRAHDDLYEEKEKERREEEVKVRETDRAAKHALADEHRKICLQSLEDDRKVLAERKAARRRRQDSLQGHNNNNHGTKSESSIVAPSSDEYEKPALHGQGTMVSEHPSLQSAPLPPVPSTPPTSTWDVDALEEALLEEDEDAEELTDREEKPWYYQQLLNMYGAEANYFLHPKIEQEKTAVTKPIDPKFRKGRYNARELWTELRYDSRMKLMHEDSQIAPELKSAYSAFVRQSLARRRKPVKRNYFSEEDVPEMAKLQDQSRITEAHNMRHKTSLMFRSSQINEDRSRVILYNNPVPDLNNLDGEESCIRYMPSWAEEGSDSWTEHSYKKWLPPGDTTYTQQQNQISPYLDDNPNLQNERYQPTPDKRLLQRELKENRDSALGPADWKDSPNVDDWQFMIAKKGSKSKKKQPKNTEYLFLTEKLAECPGEFTKRRREVYEAEHLPTVHQGAGKSESAMGMIEGNGTFTVSSNLATDSGKSNCGGRSESVMSERKFLTRWQPLSMNALVEYTEKRDIPSDGKFAQGSAPMYAIKGV